MGAKKSISNSFTVNTVEDGVDGATPQQIFYRNSNNQTPSTPATSQSDAVPSGWSATPQGVGGVYKYEWVSMRIKTNGVWGVYSTPALYAYLAEDGTSFNIKGSAITLEIGNVLDVQGAYEQPSELSKTEKGDIILGSATHTDSGDHYILRRTDKYWDEDRERYSYFVIESVQEGEAYVISAKQSVPTSYDGHFFLASPRNDDVASGIYYWKDLGYLKGAKGDDAVMYVLEPSIPQFNTDQDRTKAQVCTVRAYKIDGKTKSAFTGCFEIAPDSMLGRISYSWGNYVSLGTNDDRKATAYTVSLLDKDPRYISVDEPAPVLLASITIPIAFDGAQGKRGKIGRFFYFGGTFNPQDNDPTHGFVVNDAQAPYFEHSETVTTQSGTTTIKRYHVFNYDTNGTYTMSQMWAISSNWNNKPWEAMTNDFKYLITEAIFASFARLGSFIVSGDWLISTNGTINGTAYVDGESYNGAPAYTWFDPVYPNTDHTKTVTISGQQVTVHNFIPNLAFDGKTGETYQNRAFVRGTVYAESGYFNGSLRTTFHDISNESGWVYYSSSDTIPSGMGVGWNYLVGDYDNMCMLAKKTIPSGGTANNLHVRLPNTLSMIGRRIILYEMNQPPFSTGASFFEIRQSNGAAFVGVSAGGHGIIDFQAVYGVEICGGVVEFLAVPHPTNATICTWAIINIGGCIWNYE